MYDELVKDLRESAPKALAEADFDFVEGWLKEAADAIERLQKAVLRLEEESGILDELPMYQQPVGWIPVTERLPKYGETVLVYGSQGGIYTARYERARTEWGRDSWWKLNSKSHICNPTHWMPLPQPPKED